MTGNAWRMISKIAFFAPFLNPLVYIILFDVIASSLIEGFGDPVEAMGTLFLFFIIWALAVILIGVVPALATAAVLVLVQNAVPKLVRFPVFEITGLFLGLAAITPVLWLLPDGTNPFFFMEDASSATVVFPLMGLLSGGCSGAAAAWMARKGTA